jgi:hypothetical protein
MEKNRLRCGNFCRIEVEDRRFLHGLANGTQLAYHPRFPSRDAPSHASHRRPRQTVFPMSLDWQALFRPEMPLEMVVRGTVSYWFLFVLFRFGVRRRIGAVGMADILILVIVSDAIQQSMAGEYVSVTDGFILVAVLVGWTVFTDWLAFRFATMQRFLEPPPLLLVQDGKILRRNLRAEFLAESELQAKLREAGAADYRDVQRAFMESDGKITVILRRGASSP